MTKFQKRLILCILVLLICIASMFTCINITQKQPDTLIVQYETLKDEKIPASMNDVSILYFTDLLYGEFETEARAQKLFDEIDHLDPDIVIFGGDLFDDSCDMDAETIAKMTEWLKNIDAPLGKFAVLGEKDNLEVLTSIYAQSQFEIVNNTNIPLKNESSRGIRLIGLSTEPNIEQATTNISNNEFNLLVCHMPDTLTNDTLSTKNISLALCGHSHGTQITYPFFGGYQEIDGATQLNRANQKNLQFPYIISTGIGCTQVNFRFGSKPEIYYFNLQSIA